MPPTPGQRTLVDSGDMSGIITSPTVILGNPDEAGQPVRRLCFQFFSVAVAPDPPAVPTHQGDVTWEVSLDGSPWTVRTGRPREARPSRLAAFSATSLMMWPLRLRISAWSTPRLQGSVRSPC